MYGKYTSIDTAGYRYAGLGLLPWRARLRTANGAGPQIITPMPGEPGGPRRPEPPPAWRKRPEIITPPSRPNGGFQPRLPNGPPTVLDNGAESKPAAAGIPGGTLGVLLAVGLVLALMR